MDQQFQQRNVDLTTDFLRNIKNKATLLVYLGNKKTTCHLFKYQITSSGVVINIQAPIPVSVNSSLLSYKFQDSKGKHEMLRKIIGVVANVYPEVNKRSEVIPTSKLNHIRVLFFASGKFKSLSSYEMSVITCLVKNFFLMEGFDLERDDEIIILQNSLKLQLSWITYMYALGRGNKTNRTNVAAAYLTKSSGAVGFIPNNTKTIPESGYYLNIAQLGLQDMRRKTLKPSKRDPNILLTPCFPHDKKFKWTYRTIQYVVKGRKSKCSCKNDFSGRINYEECKESVRAVVSTLPRPPSIKNYDISAFLYYYDFIQPAGLVQMDNCGKVTLEEIEKKAKQICGCGGDEENPFLCIDLTYTVLLFHTTYGLAKTIPVQFQKTINGYELNWRMGAIVAYARVNGNSGALKNVDAQKWNDINKINT
ncbi:hypothetical protein RUM44_010570 [Polyplax serrata]|uniref:LAGLIDADG homing endonuclease n=1 Tax=Polyplax serrata TaxID=468196 RepID=A0ABR1AXF3_POLSC